MDAKDWIVLGLVSFIVLATWIWVYIHPSVPAFSVASGATGTFAALLHWIWVRDDKTADQRQQ